MSRLPGVLVCLVLSGAAALVYEIVWLRQLSIVLGTTELAAAVVLAAYMGGLALGAALGGRIAGKLRRPLLAYGLIELGIGATALAVPMLLAGARGLRDAWLGGAPELPEGGAVSSALAYAVAAFVVLLPPTILLGATLPIVVRYAVRADSEIGPRVGLLYAVNTAGAVLGVLAAGFWLIPELGLAGATRVAVGLNVVVFAVVLVLGRGEKQGAPESRDTDSAPNRSARWIAPLVLLASAASLVEEVLWTRLLAHLVGGSVAAFATMLAAFLLGIALGGATGAWLARDRAGAMRWFLVAQLGAALFGLAAFLCAGGLRSAAEAVGAGADAGLLANGAVALAALLPLTFFVGLSFPCAVRIVVGDAADAPGATGHVYAWSTIGAIVGALAAGFLLLPELGSAGTVRSAVALHGCAVLGVAFFGGFGPGARLAGAGAVLVPLVLPLRTPLSLLLASPFAGLVPPPDLDTVLFAAEGRAASVVLLEEEGVWRLRTNGHPEAEIVPPGRPPHGEHLQWWLTTLPVLARPELQRMLVVGLGGGVALEGVPPSVSAVDVIELEGEVVAANQVVADLRANDPLADPRVHVVVNDARGAMARTTAKWDAIVSQPSHPWTAGASHLYTREFLELAKARLEPGGVYVQWIGAVFLDEALLADVAATMLAVFEDVRVYRPKATTLVFLASDAPLDPERGLVEHAWTPANRAHFGGLGLHRAEDLASALALERRELEFVAKDGRVCSDDRNALAFARVIGADTGALDGVFGANDPLRLVGSTWLTEGVPHDPVLLAERLAQRRFGSRANAYLKTLGHPMAHTLATVRVYRALGRGEDAWHEAQTALLLDDANTEARFLVLEPNLGAVAAGTAPAEIVRLAEGLPDPAAAVIAGTRHVQRSEWAALEALDERLALATPAHAAYAGAVRLRATWRTADAFRADRVLRGREALALLDEALLWDPDPHGLLLRVDAAMAADDPLAALETTRVLLRWLEPGAPRLSDGTLELVARTVGALLGPRSPLAADPRVPARRFADLHRRMEAIRKASGN